MNDNVTGSKQKKNANDIKIVVVGVGGGGIKSIEKLLNHQIADKIKFIAVDDNRKTLENSKIQHTILYPDGSIFVETTIEEAEKRYLDTMEKLAKLPPAFESLKDSGNISEKPSVSHKKFNKKSRVVEEIKKKMKKGDKLYYFKSSKKSWAHLAGREGYKIYRNGKEIYCEIISMN